MSNLFLFGNNNNGVAENLGSYRLYNMTIEGDNVRDYQPVLDSNGTPTLMDKINKKYYYDKNGYGFKCEQNYKPVSYLEGDGNSWFNIGSHTLTNNSKVEITVANRSWSNVRECLFTTSTKKVLTLFEVSSYGKFTYDFGHTSWLDSQSFLFSLDTKYTFTLSNLGVTQNGNLLTTSSWTNETGNINETAELYIFRYWDRNPEGHSTATCKLYEFKLYEGSEIVFDGIPVLDKNNTPCIYDKVSQQFFYNQGSGTFGYGIEELECPKANYIEYIKGSKSYFNTLDISGKVDSNLEVECKYKLSAYNKNFSCMGTVEEWNMNPLIIGNMIHKDSSTKQAFWCTLFGNEVKIDTTQEFVGVHTIKMNKTGVYLDGVLKAELNQDYEYKTKYTFVQPLAILAHNYWNNVQNLSQEIIYYVTLRQNGETILDFRPCIDDDGIVCLYESVNDVYYKSTGEVNGFGNPSHTPIKYIESDGNQYIDTGVVLTDNTDIDMECRATNLKPSYIMNGLILDGTYQYNGMNTTVEGNITANTGATLTLGDTYGAMLDEEEVLSAIINGWTLSGINYITKVGKDIDTTTLTTDENITTCLIELTNDNKGSTRITEVLAYYPNCNHIAFYQDGSVTSLSQIFQTNSTYKNQLTKITFLEGYFPNNYSMRYCFNGCQNLEKIVNLPTPNALQNAFQNCYKLNQPFDFSNAPTDTNMDYAFGGCKALTYSPKLPNGMKGSTNNCFNHCESLTTIDISNIQSTSNATQTFQYCTKLTKIIGIEKLVATRTKYAHSIFEHCESLESIDISGWDTSGCEQLGTPSSYAYGGMFASCYKLKTITGLDNIDFSGLKGGSVSFSLAKFFRNCYELTSLDLSSWDVSKIVDFGEMFYGCKKLQTLNLTGWDVSLNTTYGGMFYGCTSLTEIKGVETWTKDATTTGMYQKTPLLNTYYVPLNDSSSGWYNNKIFTGDSSLASKTIVWKNEINYSFALVNFTEPNGVYLSQKHVQDLIPEHLGDLTATGGTATLTLGGYSSYLTEDEIAQAVAKGWVVQ
jgi:surface protein